MSNEINEEYQSGVYIHEMFCDNKDLTLDKLKEYLSNIKDVNLRNNVARVYWLCTNKDYKTVCDFYDSEMLDEFCDLKQEVWYFMIALISYETKVNTVLSEREELRKKYFDQDEIVNILFKK